MHTESLTDFNAFHLYSFVLLHSEGAMEVASWAQEAQMHGYRNALSLKNEIKIIPCFDKFLW